MLQIASHNNNYNNGHLVKLKNQQFTDLYQITRMFKFSFPPSLLPSFPPSLLPSFPPSLPPSLPLNELLKYVYGRLMLERNNKPYQLTRLAHHIWTELIHPIALTRMGSKHKTDTLLNRDY